MKAVGPARERLRCTGSRPALHAPADCSGGTFLIANNVIADNGSSSSTVGGADLNGTVIFVNNTVASNDALSTKAGGIICSGGIEQYLFSKHLPSYKQRRRFPQSHRPEGLPKGPAYDFMDNDAP